MATLQDVRLHSGFASDPVRPNATPQKRFQEIRRRRSQWLDTQPGDGSQSLRPLSDIDDVSVQIQRSLENQLSRQRIYEKYQIRETIRKGPIHFSQCLES